MPRIPAAAAAALSTLVLILSALFPPLAAAAEPLTVRLSSPADGSSTHDPTPTFTGSGTVGATLDVELDGITFAAVAEIEPDGRWTWTTPERLTQGGHRVRVTARASGSDPVSTGLIGFTFDSIAPAQPNLYAPSFSAQPDGRPRFTGMAEGGSQIDLYIDDVRVGRTTVARGPGSGSFEVGPDEDVPLAPQHRATVTATDAAGNTSTPSWAVTFVVPSQRPTVELRQGSVTNDQTPDVIGSAAPDAEVQLVVDDRVETVRSGSDGGFAYAITTPLGEGPHTLSAVVVRNGTEISPRGTITIEIDLTPPPPPPIYTELEGRIVGPRPRLSGGAEGSPGPRVNIFLDGAFIGRALWGSYEGIPHDWWDFQFTTPLSDGQHALFATTVDAAGNTSARSPLITFTVDGTPPTAPVIETPAEGGLVSRVVLTGHADPRATLTYLLDGSRTPRAVTLDAAGRFHQVLEIYSGTHRVVLTSTLATEVTSSTSRSFSVDTTVPKAPVVTHPAAGSATVDPTPMFEGTGEPGATVRASLVGYPTRTVVVGPSGGWTLPPPSPPLPAGEHTVRVDQVDAAGNVSALATVTFVVRAPEPTPSLTTAPAPTPSASASASPSTSAPGSPSPRPVSPTAAASAGAGRTTAAASAGAGRTSVDAGTSLARTGGPSVVLTVLGALLLAGAALLLRRGGRRR